MGRPRIKFAKILRFFAYTFPPNLDRYYIHIRQALSDKDIVVVYFFLLLNKHKICGTLFEEDFPSYC